MGKRRYTKSFEIALSAISCAVAVICLLAGYWSGILLASGYFFGILALMVPLSKQFYLGDFLAYVGTCVLTLIMGAIGRGWLVAPFIMFFGLHPLVNSLQLKFNVNKWLAFFVKAAWFDGTLVAAYFLIFGGVLGGSFLPAGFYEVLNDYIYLFIFAGGTVFFIAYDFVIFKCQSAVNKIVERIKK